MSKLNDKEIEELFKDAPDDAEYCFYLSDNYWYAWIKDIRVNSYKYIAKDDKNKSWRINNGDITNTGELIPRPTKTSKLIYTKEMADSGIFPIAGMECLVRESEWSDFYQCKVAFTDENVIFIKYKDVETNVEVYKHFGLEVNIEFKPVDTRTDEEKAFAVYWDSIEYSNGVDSHKSAMEKAFKAGVKWTGWM